MKWLQVASLLSIAYSVPCLAVDANQASVTDLTHAQRGALVFMSRCAGCHALTYLRVPQLVEELQLQAVVNNPANARLLSLNQSVLSEASARALFGRMPPDLSLVAQSKGSDWLHRYLTGFYPDKTRPLGTNNLVVPGVSMPNPYPIPPNASVVELRARDALVNDTIAFLRYVADPSERIRHRIGWVVLGFIALLWCVVFALQRQYWRYYSSVKKSCNR